ncbi:hypothetical protein IV102_21875 [bacterium]|nr:hypothetical protein [bacterium]
MEVRVMDPNPQVSESIRLGNPPVSVVIISLGFEPVAIPLSAYGDLIVGSLSANRGRHRRLC